MFSSQDFEVSGWNFVWIHRSNCDLQLFLINRLSLDPWVLKTLSGWVPQFPVFPHLAQAAQTHDLIHECNAISPVISSFELSDLFGRFGFICFIKFGLDGIIAEFWVFKMQDAVDFGSVLIVGLVLLIWFWILLQTVIFPHVGWGSWLILLNIC